MEHPSTDFFEDLAARGHEPLLEATTGTLHFELKEKRRTNHWHVTLRKGDVDVSNSDSAADVVLHMDTGLLDDVTSGRANIIAALLRGEVSVEGDLALAMSFQRLFPGPATSLASV